VGDHRSAPPFEISLQGLRSHRARRGDGHRAYFSSGDGYDELVRVARRVNYVRTRPPRLTLARGRRAVDLSALDTGAITFPVDRLALVRSDRGAGEAVYTIVDGSRLPSVGPPPPR
jgi:hypothetical protein